MQQPSPVFFDRDLASSYDSRAAHWKSVSDALHLLMRNILSDLPRDAHVLSVGAGTGAELLSLAEHFPNWRFTAVEPAPAMMELCQRKVQAAGISARCTFHQGYLDSLPPSEPFDAATCILVSHFILQSHERRKFFQDIGARLRPGGVFISADIAGDMSSPNFSKLFPIWMQMQRGSGVPPEDVEKMRAVYGKNVAVLPAPDVEAIIASSGFETPELFFQALLIHAWFSRQPNSI